ncbi:PP2C family protein-serine/threonine phosphatase [Streptomyces sp. NPDC005899]|uniref:PP2C family protein-serine/threonine phosphatase n=1 Tax=Streptomyces sp. NPDC005899 TaxID=3155716 RepID=UPI0033F322EB
MARDVEQMLVGLLETSHTMSMEELPGTVREYAAKAGLNDVLIYLADLQEDRLRLLTGRGLDAGEGGGSSADEVPVDGSLPGRAYQTVQELPEEGTGKHRWWVPMLDGAERIGVLRVDVDPGSAGEQARPMMRHLATLVTMLVVDKRPHSDSYARRVRIRPMNVAAEMQWNLMPPRAFANKRVTISAALEPAYEVGGDAFDYALADDTVHLGIFDAMGHDIAAGLAANLAVAACRNARRQGATLLETGQLIEQVLVRYLAQTRYVTAILADLDLSTGALSWISHGHHSPILVRESSWSRLPPCPPGPPLGTDLGLAATMCRAQLNPGDRIVLYTDGITEPHAPGGEEFGLDRFMDFVLHHNADGMPVPETLRRLIHSILDYHRGRLKDDATVLFLEWHGPHPRDIDRNPGLAFYSHPDGR